MTGKTAEAFGRHSIRLKGYDYFQAGGYYVTMVAYGRECLFGEVTEDRTHINALGRIVQECWDEIPVHFPHAEIDTFCIMPNHVHGIIFLNEIPVGARYISPLPPPPRPSPSSVPSQSNHQPLQQEQSPHGFKSGSIGAIVASFKAAVSRRAGRELNSGNIWQRNYYEHIIRDQLDYERIAGYILENPLHWVEDDENPGIMCG